MLGGWRCVGVREAAVEDALRRECKPIVDDVDVEELCDGGDGRRLHAGAAPAVEPIRIKASDGDGGGRLRLGSRGRASHLGAPGNHCWPVTVVVLRVARRSDVREEPREQQPWLCRAVEVQALAVGELLQQAGARMSRSGNVPSPRCPGQEAESLCQGPLYTAHRTGSDAVPVAQWDTLADV